MDTNERFFDRPILDAPCAHPPRHRELDEDGQPINRILDRRRRGSFVTAVPAPKKRKAAQRRLDLDEAASG